jgi:hypothetical protein
VISADSVLVLQPDVRYRAVAPETVVVRQSVPEVMVLSEVAGAILERLDGRRPLREVVDALAPLYDTDRATLERDVLAFAAELVEKGVAAEARA